MVDDMLKLKKKLKNTFWTKNIKTRHNSNEII